MTAPARIRLGRHVRAKSRWWEQAACLGLEPQFDHPERINDDARKQVQEVRKVCAGCPVIDECAEDAIAHEDSGVRGGQLLWRGKPDDMSKRRRR